ncbi:hypothetical protein D1007_27990 [Hordeum vulgare]|nr:hypothetical protein D1007_27990 [Hordeum vulgare]
MQQSREKTSTFVTPELHIIQGQKSVGKDMQQKPEDSISDALSAKDVQVGQAGPAGSQVSVDRPPDLGCDAVQGEGYAAQWGPPGELLPLFSTPRLTLQACCNDHKGWAGLFNADAPHAYWASTCQLTSAGSRCYELPPLPPSLESPVWDWLVLQQPSLVQRGWPPILGEGTYWLPGWDAASLQVSRAEPYWTPSPEGVFGPGAGINYVPIIEPPVQSEEEKRARRALADANLTGLGLVAAITQRVAALQIDEQRAFIGKISSLLWASILSSPPWAISSRQKMKKKLLGAVKAPRQSARLSRMQSSFSSSRRSQAAICVHLGLIKREADFNDSTLRAYVDFFREPMPPENVAKLTQIAGLSSPAQLRLPESELQAILEELSVRAA